MVALVHREWETAKIVQTLSTRVVTVGNISIGIYTSEMDSVPTPSLEQKQALFSVLHDLHMRGIVHGDARIQNAILLPDGIIWIDFATASIVSNVFVLIANDFNLLFESVFRPEAKRCTDLSLHAVLDNKEITAEAWESLDLLTE